MWGKEEVLILKTRSLLIQIVKSQGITHTRVLPDQERKKKALKISNKLKIKIKEFLVTSVLLWAGNNSGKVRCRERSIAMHHCCPQCGLPYTDALPYRPSSQASREQGSIVNKNAKTTKTLSATKFENNEPNKIIKSQIRFLQSCMASALMKHIMLLTLKRSPDKIKL